MARSDTTGLSEWCLARTNRRGSARYRGVALAAALSLIACGRTTLPTPSGSGGRGGSSASGGAGAAGGTAGKSSPPLSDCANPLADGTPCSQPSSHCGGPCSNSWQTDYVCENGNWKFKVVVACGPGASSAPRCKNSFSGGQLTPCCPTSKLDCNGKPDGWPGFGCTPGDGSFCSCTCSRGEQSCGC